jgi:SAM-dependent methyltransferase
VDDPTGATRVAYDAIAARFLDNARDRTAVAPHLARFAAALPRQARVLDVGAGPGIHTAALRAHGLRASSLDFSLGMLRAGVAEFPGPRLQGDARRLPIATSSLGGIWANASLLHLQRADALDALREARRVLSPGGVLFVSVKEGVGAETETSRYGQPRFFQYWSSAELDDAIAGAGFVAIDARAEEAPNARWLVRLARRLA